MKFDLNINVWSIVCAGAAFLYMAVVVQADVKYLQVFYTGLQAENAKLSDRVKFLEAARYADKEAVVTIQGDIRVIRQILESGKVSK